MNASMIIFLVGAAAAAWPIQGLVRHFRPELERRIAERTGKQMLEAAE